jgi:hypothetical protein
MNDRRARLTRPRQFAPARWYRRNFPLESIWRERCLLVGHQGVRVIRVSLSAARPLALAVGLAADDDGTQAAVLGIKRGLIS